MFLAVCSNADHRALSLKSEAGGPDPEKSALACVVEKVFELVSLAKLTLSVDALFVSYTFEMPVCGRQVKSEAIDLTDRTNSSPSMTNAARNTTAVVIYRLRSCTLTRPSPLPL